MSVEQNVFRPQARHWCTAFDSCTCLYSYCTLLLPATGIRRPRKSSLTFIVVLQRAIEMTGSIKDVSKMNVHVPKRKHLPDAESPGRPKAKRFKSNMSETSEASSILTPSVAYGVHEPHDQSYEFDCDDDLLSTTESIKPVKVSIIRMVFTSLKSLRWNTGFLMFKWLSKVGYVKYFLIDYWLYILIVNYWMFILIYFIYSSYRWIRLSWTEIMAYYFLKI